MSGNNDKLLLLLLGIFLGWCGVPRFYKGDMIGGVKVLVCFLLTTASFAFLPAIVASIAGIIVLICWILDVVRIIKGTFNPKGSFF